MFIHVAAGKLSVGDVADFIFKPGCDDTVRVTATKVLSVPTSKSIEVRWENPITNEILFEGLYGVNDEVLVLDRTGDFK